MKGTYLALIVLIGAVLPAAAQDPLLSAKGWNPNQSYNIGDFDSVNLYNGNLTVRIPLISYPQKGSMPDLSLSYIYNPITYTMVLHEDPPDQWYEWEPVWSPYSPHPEGIIRDGEMGWNVEGYYPWGTILKVTASDGAVHYMGTTGYSQSGSVDTTSYQAIDASGVGAVDTYDASTGTSTFSVRDRSGIQHTRVLTSSSSQAYSSDPSGNQITINATSLTWTDTIGRTIPMMGIPNGCATTYFPAAGSGTVPIQICGTNKSILTAFNYSTVQEYIGTKRVPTSITLPNGKSWTFAHNSYGEITSVTLPTGATVTYTWGYGSGGGLIREPRITKRSVNLNDGSAVKEWIYAYSTSPSTTTAVTDPEGNKTVHYFDLHPTVTSPASPHETKREYYQGTSTLLKTVTTAYSWGGLNPYSWLDGSELYYSLVTKRVTTEWAANNQRAQVCTFHDNYDSSSISSDAQFLTDCNESGTSADGHNSSGPTFYDANVGTTPTYPLVYGSEVVKFEYDYVSSAIGSLLRKTETAYQWQSSSSFKDTNLLDRINQLTIRDGSGNEVAQTRFGYDASGCSSTPCGLQTSVTRENGSSDPATTTTYNSNGMRTNVYDPGSHRTEYLYDSTGLFLSGIRYYTGSSTYQSEGFAYDPDTGMMTSFTDRNSNVTTYAYDDMRRMTSVSYPDGGGKTWNYHSDPVPPYVTQTTESAPDADQVLVTRFDKLGRVKQTEQSDPENAVYVDTTYNDRGEVECVSNPYRTGSEDTDGDTCYEYDALGRTTKVIRQDADEVTTSYTGSCTTVADETGRLRKSCMDGLGRINLVHEPDPSTNSLTSGHYETLYTYDPLDNLTYVNQKGDNSAPRTRTFTYDKLSRLLTAANPESGTITYTYNADGNVLTKVAPLPNQTGSSTVTVSYGYDDLHRVTGRTHTDGTPPVYFDYDTSTWGFPVTNPIGRLIQTQRTGYANQVFSYDSMGRIDNHWSYVGSSWSGYATATYNKAGQMSSLTYPSGRKVKYAYTSAARLSNVNLDTFAGQTVNQDYWTATSNSSDPRYHPHGALRKATFGNSVLQHDQYNDRLQPTRMTTSLSTQTWADRSYNWIKSSNNNGNVWGITDHLTSGRSQEFDYDQLNRIIEGESVATSGPDAWAQTFTIDPWGNLQQSGTISFIQSFGADNRISTGNFTYDSAGNLTGNGSGTSYAYDAENHIKSVEPVGAAYTYDADGKRVRKESGGNTTHYFYFNGQVVAEHSAQPEQKIDNSGFESGMTGWSGGGTVTTDASKAHSGSKYLQHSTSSAVSTVYTTYIAVRPGEVVRFGGWVYRESGNGYNSWKLAAYDSGYNPVAYPGSFSPSFGSWQLQNEAYTVPGSGVAYVRLYCEIWAATVSSVARFDDGFLISDAGAHPTNNWTDYIYAGGQRIAKAGQQVDNSGFESGMGGWVWGGSEATAVTDASKAHSGTKYLQLSTSTGVVSAHDKVLAVRTGEVVRFGGWVYPESGDGSSFWKLVAYDSGMNPVEYPGYITLSQGSWQLQDQTYTVPSGVAYVRLYTQIYQPTGASVVRFDDGFLIAGTEYYHGDHLGSSRLMTDASGAKTWEATYLPFGYEINPQSTTNHYKFTGKERDSETGLDYFGARYFASTMGRFTSVDPKGVSLRHLLNPQKLNKYSYVLNNPLALVDPDGMEEITVVYRTFIPQRSVSGIFGTFAGDNRGFSTAANASSRSSISIRLETDASIRANPIISVTSGAGATHRLDGSGNIIQSGTATTGLPTATASRDANGNVVLGIEQSVKNPLTPQLVTPAIDANLTINIPQNASGIQVTGTADDFPAQELNVTRDGNTTGVMQYEPPAGASPFSLFPPDRTVNIQRQLPQCSTNDEGKRVCN